MTETEPLPTLVRAFHLRTRISQERLARESGVSLATVNKINRAGNGARFAPETEERLRGTIRRLLDQEQVGGWELTVEVQRLRDDYGQLRREVAAIRDLVTDGAH